MRTVRPRIFAVTVALLLAACGDTNGGTAGDEPDEPAVEQTDEDADADDEAAQDDADDEASAEQDADDAPVDDTSEYTFGIESITVETGGIEIELLDFGAVPIGEFDEEDRTFLDDDTAAVVALNMRVTNTRDDTLAIYPDQGTLVLGSEQIEAAVFLSDSVGGDFFGQVTKEGVVLFESSQDLDAIRALGEARYLVDGPNDEDFERTGDNVDVTLTW